jgi:hypothetical protein
MKEEVVIANFKVLTIQQLPGRTKEKNTRSQLVLQLRLKLGTYQMSHTSEHSHPA